MSLAIRKQSLKDQVSEYLRQAISTGRFADGKLPKERNLAEIINVSRGTVRAALAELSDEGLIVRVRRRGTMIGPTVLRKLRAKKTGTLGLVYSVEYGTADPEGNSFYSAVLNGIVKCAVEKKRLLTVSMAENELGGKDFIEISEHMKVDGILLMALTNIRLVRKIAGLGVPLISVDHWDEEFGIDAVNPDSFGGAREAVRYLARLGHRRIGYLNWWKYPLNIERFSGYQEGLKEAGLPYTENLVKAGTSDQAGGYRAMQEMLDSDIVPTAVLAFSDDMAVGAMRAATERGLRIPADLSVVGFGGFATAALCSPALTTMHVDKARIGSTSVERLLARIDNPGLKIENILVPVKLIEKESCAPPNVNGFRSSKCR